MTVKRIPCEVYSRVVGYFRPVKNWNLGKQAEFSDRLPYDVTKSMVSSAVLHPQEMPA